MNCNLELLNLKYRYMAQRTNDWYKAKWGLLTSTSLSTLWVGEWFPGVGSSSKMATDLLKAKAIQRITDWEYTGEIYAKPLIHGRQYEAEAADVYEQITGNKIEPVGFVVKIPGVFGSSPDGLIGPRGGVEIKCPYVPSIHRETRETRTINNRKYEKQVFGNLYATNREWWDYVSYDPREPDETCMCIIRVMRSHPVMVSIEKRIREANDLINKIIEDGTKEFIT
jgi:hypothetical protein